MYKGTTPTFILTINTDLDLDTDTSEVWVSVKDFGGTVYNWEKTDLEIDENEISLTLTQTETLAFAAGLAEIQVHRSIL